MKKIKSAPESANVITALAKAQLEKHKSIKVLKVKRAKREKLTALAGKLIDQKIALSVMPILELSARHPYDDAGSIDFRRPAWWDTYHNLVFMDVTGPSPNECDYGTIGYVHLQAPADAMYVIFVFFAGNQISMRMNGPWGTVETSVATTSDPGLVLAVWSASSGDGLDFTVDCVGSDIGPNYLASIEVYEVIL